ncbi:hypothetical protein [Pseudoprimorskyibacter insulae]|uniref:Flagellar biosynthetic protein FliO n=1 Tax=Pseudoprimorskyibacter insulae TaxID=1695997 RepID=A0A2R8AW43_9RHOB|nr:hypothetical protein [Pseudoprimorskyibacter insulae]SPF80089.1 hypothetical protein PRI8871_01891 [Pseudoprimorskyibacter insulae]
METLSPDRLIIVLLFLGALLALRYYVTRNRDVLSKKISGDRRLKLCEALPINGGRVYLLEADGERLCVVAGGKGAPTVVQLGTAQEVQS